MRRLAGAVLAVLLLTLLTACDGGVPSPGRSNVDVDTPELREQKAAADIEDCVPGDGEGDLPDLTLPCLGGGPDVDLSTLQGPVLINLWNTGCVPCRDEMPLLQEVHDRYSGQVTVLGIDVDTQPELAISFAESIGATYPQLADPGATIFDSGLRVRPGFPQTLFVDADGEMSHVEVGEVESFDEVSELIETHLGVAAVSAP